MEKKSISKRVCGLSAGIASAVVVTTASMSYAQVSHTIDRSGKTAMSGLDRESIAAIARPVEQLRRTAPTRQLQAPGEPGGDAAAPRVQRGGSGDADRIRTGDLNFTAPEIDIPPQIGTQNFGEGHLNTYLHYNDYLKVPYPVGYEPWRAAGKFFFELPDGGWYSCTAAMIAPSILVTAGHCVHEGGNGEAGWMTDGYFVPAYSQSIGNSRYGYCDVEHVTTTDGWFNIGELDEGYDVALAVCGYRSGTTNRFMGDRVGWFAFCYENCRQDWWFLTQIGYPGNYYGGQEMTVSQHVSRAEGIWPDFFYGTGMRGGSSGGPHVSNIGEISDSSTSPGQYPDRNVIFAVTSWGYNNQTLKVQGASPLSGMDNDTNFRRMYNQTCVWARQNLRRRACERID